MAETRGDGSSDVRGDAGHSTHMHHKECFALTVMLVTRCRLIVEALYTKLLECFV